MRRYIIVTARLKTNFERVTLGRDMLQFKGIRNMCNILRRERALDSSVISAVSVFYFGS
jgi:hypothetical protein